MSACGHRRRDSERTPQTRVNLPPPFQQLKWWRRRESNPLRGVKGTVRGSYRLGRGSELYRNHVREQRVRFAVARSASTIACFANDPDPSDGLLYLASEGAHMSETRQARWQKTIPTVY